MSVGIAAAWGEIYSLPGGEQAITCEMVNAVSLFDLTEVYGRDLATKLHTGSQEPLHYLEVSMSAELMKKVIGVPLQKSLEKDEKGFLKVRGYFTSDAQDEVGDIITKSATERAVPIYRQWGNIRQNART